MGSEDTARLWDYIEELRKDSKESLKIQGQILGVLDKHTLQLDSGDKKFDKCETRLDRVETVMVVKPECEKRHDSKWRYIATVFTGLSVAAAWAMVIFKFVS